MIFLKTLQMWVDPFLKMLSHVIFLIYEYICSIYLLYVIYKFWVLISSYVSLLILEERYNFFESCITRTCQFLHFECFSSLILYLPNFLIYLLLTYMNFKTFFDSFQLHFVSHDFILQERADITFPVVDGLFEWNFDNVDRG